LSDRYFSRVCRGQNEAGFNIISDPRFEGLEGGITKPILAKPAGKKAGNVARMQARQEAPLRFRTRRLLGRQEVFAIRPIVRRRLLKTAQSDRPQFHAIQIIVQAIQRLDEIASNHVSRAFRHLHRASIPQSTFPAPRTPRGFGGLLFRFLFTQMQTY